MTKAPTSQNFRSYTGALKPAHNTEGEAARTAKQDNPSPRQLFVLPLLRAQVFVACCSS